MSLGGLIRLVGRAAPDLGRRLGMRRGGRMSSDEIAPIFQRQDYDESLVGRYDAPEAGYTVDRRARPEDSAIPTRFIEEAAGFAQWQGPPDRTLTRVLADDDRFRNGRVAGSPAEPGVVRIRFVDPSADRRGEWIFDESGPYQQTTAMTELHMDSGSSSVRTYEGGSSERRSIWDAFMGRQ